MPFYAQVMPDAQQRMLRDLGSFATDAQFYLAVGTAIAIHLGHRRSLDLDWFTAREISDPMRLATDLRRSLDGFAIADVAEGTVHGIAGGVRLSFLEYLYPSVAPLLDWPEYRCQLAGLEDLACMKLSAIANRGAKKDFIDVYALGRTRFSLDEMLDLYRRKFAVQDTGHLLMSLTYFDDAEDDEMPEMFWDVDWKEVKHTVEGWVREHVNRQKPPGSKQGPIG